jgi:hypothetical protein
LIDVVTLGIARAAVQNMAWFTPAGRAIADPPSSVRRYFAAFAAPPCANNSPIAPT